MICIVSFDEIRNVQPQQLYMMLKNTQLKKILFIFVESCMFEIRKKDTCYWVKICKKNQIIPNLTTISVELGFLWDCASFTQNLFTLS